GEAVTVALSGDFDTGEPNSSATKIGLVPYVEPAANPAFPVAQAINALSSGTEITLGAIDPTTQKAEPLLSAIALPANESSTIGLPTEPLRYVFLSSSEPDTLVTPAPAITIDAQPGEVWSFFPNPPSL
ncbi:MAG: hypothetical protein MUF34_31440, partial [Polyangiaceae bacterium]|nr:hypothetical protein [Polyangiaceae bacterium]